MLVFILFFTLSSSAVVAQAFTRAQFVGSTGVIRILARDYAGMTDTDGQQLFDNMNVPPRDSIIGPGKAIETADKRLRFICAQRSQVGTECSIFIHNTTPGLVDPSRKIMQYKITGEKAKEYAKLFKVDSQGIYFFVSIDGTFKVDIKPGSFEVYYSENSTSRVHQGPVENLAGTLVIVNVEDTLKITHVRNFWDSLNYAQDMKKQFLGMNIVLKQLANHNPQLRFIYLIQSPELLVGKTEVEFLNNNNFPRGETRTYRSNADKAARLKVLKELLFQVQSETSLQNVLLLSHNGNPDVEAFHDLTLLFKDLHFFSYFHIVYSSSSFVEPGQALYPEQTGFVTSMELLVDWEQKGFVDSSSVAALAPILVSRIVSENISTKEDFEYAIPRFVNCEDFQWRWSVVGDYQFLTPLRDYLQVRCQRSISTANKKS